MERLIVKILSLDRSRSPVNLHRVYLSPSGDKSSNIFMQFDSHGIVVRVDQCDVLWNVL